MKKYNPNTGTNCGFNDDIKPNGDDVFSMISSCVNPCEANQAFDNKFPSLEDLDKLNLDKGDDNEQ